MTTTFEYQKVTKRAYRKTLFNTLFFLVKPVFSNEAYAASTLYVFQPRCTPSYIRQTNLHEIHNPITYLCSV